MAKPELRFGPFQEICDNSDIFFLNICIVHKYAFYAFRNGDADLPGMVYGLPHVRLIIHSFKFFENLSVQADEPCSIFNLYHACLIFVDLL